MKELFRSMTARSTNAGKLKTPEGRLMYELGLVRLCRADRVASRSNGNNGFVLNPPKKARKA